MPSLRPWRRLLSLLVHGDRAAPLTRKRDLFLAFALVSLPFLVIAILLLVFIFNSHERDKPSPLSYESRDLPVKKYDTKSTYYTGIDTGRVLLLGSWASNIAEIVIAPFMVIFSYAVAREVVREKDEKDTKSDERPPFLSEIMRGSHSTFLFNFSSSRYEKREWRLSL